MTTPTGWLCPSCGKAHGPHVSTCPGEVSVSIINPAPDEIAVTKRESRTDLGKVVEVYVNESIAKGGFDKTTAARYGASPKGAHRA